LLKKFGFENLVENGSTIIKKILAFYEPRKILGG